MSVPVRRKQVAYGRERGLSARRACTLFSVARSALGYLSRKAVRDANVVAHRAALSAQYPRYGYRRIQIFLGRDGHAMSSGRAYRLWRLATLQVPRKRGRKGVAASRPRPQTPTAANQVWSYDFVFDNCANGQRLHCLTVTDEFTRERLAIDVGVRLRSARVIEVLSRRVSERGAPAFLRSDNGPEFVSRALLKWITEQGISTALIDPGKPWQNGVGESFNGKFRDECLSVDWFRSRAEAKVVIETWRSTSTKSGRIPAWATRPRRRLLRVWQEPSPAKQRAGTLRYVGPARPGPLRHRPFLGTRKRRPVSQVKSDPKKLGRSVQPKLDVIER